MSFKLGNTNIGELYVGNSKIAQVYLGSSLVYQLSGPTPPEPGTADIGGRTYSTVTINGVTWLTENLDFKFPGCKIGKSGSSSTEPRANYYNNDESTYGINGNKYGLLYNWAAVKYLNDNRATLIPGWHVPTTNEWDALANAVGGTDVAGTKLKSSTGWSSGNGTDDYGFAVFPAGCRYANGSFSYLGSWADFWTPTQYSSNYAYYCYFGSGTSMYSSDTYKTSGYSVRLVKDAT